MSTCNLSSIQYSIIKGNFLRVSFRRSHHTHRKMVTVWVGDMLISLTEIIISLHVYQIMLYNLNIYNFYLKIKLKRWNTDVKK